MSTLVTGGTGWVGRQLIPHLDQPRLVSRNADAAARKLGQLVSRKNIIQWDPLSGPLDLAEWDTFDTVINLMGDPIAAGRWTDAKRQRIRNSRVMGTQNLVQSLMKRGRMPGTFISASAIGFYGDRGETIIDESSAAGDDFLADVCQQWEQAAMPLAEAGVRVAWLRIGIVLGQGGGALGKMLPPFRRGLGGRLGSGRQWMSWIHIDDLLQLIGYSIENDSVCGPINAVAPNPLRNIEFTKALGGVLHRPTLIPVPKIVLRVALGEFANFLLASQRVVPTAATGFGFEFQRPTITDALNDLLGTEA